MDMNSVYICALSCNGQICIYINILKARLGNKITDCHMEKTSIDISLFSSHSIIQFFDTSEITKKMLCAKNINNMNIECINISYNVTENKKLTKMEYFVYEKNIILSFPIVESNNEDCVYLRLLFQKFYFVTDEQI